MSSIPYTRHCRFGERLPKIATLCLTSRGYMATALPYWLVLTTCPDGDMADRIAEALVKEGLAACVNVLPAMRSVYRWRGNIESTSEHLVIIKIRSDDYLAVEQRIRALHSYELPEVIAVPLVGGLAGYLGWIENPDATS